MSKHEKCRKACTKAMWLLRGLYGTRIKITVGEPVIRRLSDGSTLTPEYKVRAPDIRRHVWTWSACCKWRAKTRMAREIIASARDWL